MASEHMLGLLELVVVSLWFILVAIGIVVGVLLRLIKYSKQRVKSLQSIEKRIEELTFKMRMK